MSATPPVIPAAWYPDPEGGPRQRYWDGTQWTEHYHPPHVAVPSAATVGVATVATSAPKRGKGKLIGIIAGATAVVVGLTSFLVWGLPALTGGGEFGGAAVTEADWEYSFTQPVVIEPDAPIEFDVNYDLMALANEREAPDPEFPTLYDPSFAFEVFTDAALTLHAESRVYQYEPDGPVEVQPYELSTAEDSDFNEVRLREGDGFEWGLNAEYYLVRYLDVDGQELDKPIVTKFTVERELEAPIVTFSTPDNNGNLTMEWAPVEGATEYIIVASHTFGDSKGAVSRIYNVLDRVSDNSWSSAVSSFEADVAPWYLTQNEDMNLFGGAGSADSIEMGFSTAGDEGEYVYGVIATDGQTFSGYVSHNAKDVAGSLPYETAFGANRDLKNWGPSGYIEGIENVQTKLAFTSLDGTTRATVAYIVPDEVVDYGDRWVLSLRGRGTMLGEWVPVLKSSITDISAAVAQFNAAAEDAAPTTGMPTFDVISAPIDELAAGLKTPPPTDYPVYGSSDFVKFLAQHMIAQTRVVDISDFVGKAGVPEPFDAAFEAMYQNPYVINVEGINLGSDNKLYISYYQSDEEAYAIQQAVHEKSLAVVDEVVSDGMSDAEIVTALNNWITANAEYDYPALAALDANVWGGLPTGYEYAWNTKGILVDGLGVCASYSYAFNALANEAGVQTVVVTGDVTDGGPHAWNKVLIDGQWLSVDVTWNDSPDANRYLMIPDSGFTGNATRTEGNNWIVDLLQSKYATAG